MLMSCSCVVNHRLRALSQCVLHVANYVEMKDNETIWFTSHCDVEMSGCVLVCYFLCSWLCMSKVLLVAYSKILISVLFLKKLVGI